LRENEGVERWIMLETIYEEFNLISLVHEYITICDLFEIMKLSTVVEVKEENTDCGVKQEVTYYIRKKENQENLSKLQSKGVPLAL
jgi:hypothetical protein